METTGSLGFRERFGSWGLESRDEGLRLRV